MTQNSLSLDDFEAELLSHDSATQALTNWCERRGIADVAAIRAVPVAAGHAAGEAAIRTELAAADDAPLGYRHVRLVCGDTVLSEAHNWFVPERLTPAMNRTLETTDTPFGVVAGALGFTRTRLDSARAPFPPQGALRQCPVDTVLSRRALLRLPVGRPLALLVECYTAANLAPARD